MYNRNFYIINAITTYRLLASFILLYFLITGQLQLFRVFLLISFFTDAIDGFLARRFKVTSAIGSIIDSIADDLTMLMGIIGVFVFKPGFIEQQQQVVMVLLSLYLLQTTLALLKYHRISSFHTYLAKVATVFQCVFLLLLFFLPESPLYLFVLAATLTILDLLEEIILVMLIPKWKTDVKGLFWILKQSHSHAS
jgi:phosphatidylglycerophosphate synthase